MCTICAAMRPFDDDCVYTDAAAQTGTSGTGTEGAPAGVTLTETEILDAMQFDLSLLTDETINTTEDEPYEFTFQFDDDELPSYPGVDFSGWTAWTAAEKAAVRELLDYVETIINVTFTEVTGDSDPDMNLGKVTIPGNTIGFGGYSYSASGGQLTDYDNYAVFDNTLDISSGQENLILHEIGHALGLKHPFSGATLPQMYENNKYSVMSYTENPDNGERSDGLQLFDILALQDRWGANDDTNGGNTKYTGSSNSTIDAIWDTGGKKDEFDASSRTNDVKLDLREGYFSQFGSIEDVVIAFGTVIENAKGGKGDDTINGNDVKNKLNGGSGNDDLLGYGGNDNVKGGGGSDELRGGDGNDKMNGGGGNDDLYGGAGKDKLDGSKGNDQLTGNGGADKFVMKKKGGTDVITDFQDDTDLLQLKFNGLNTVSDALALAKNQSGNVVFNFDDGSKLTVEDITKNEIRDDIAIL